MVPVLVPAALLRITSPPAPVASMVPALLNEPEPPVLIVRALVVPLPLMMPAD
jgi:hypothetical protein